MLYKHNKHIFQTLTLFVYKLDFQKVLILKKFLHWHDSDLIPNIKPVSVNSGTTLFRLTPKNNRLSFMFMHKLLKNFHSLYCHLNVCSVLNLMPLITNNQTEFLLFELSDEKSYGLNCLPTHRTGNNISNPSLNHHLTDKYSIQEYTSRFILHHRPEFIKTVNTIF